MGQGVAPVAWVRMGALGARVALVWFEGDYSCPGGVLVEHGVKESEGVIWLMVQ